MQESTFTLLAELVEHLPKQRVRMITATIELGLLAAEKPSDFRNVVDRVGQLNELLTDDVFAVLGVREDVETELRESVDKVIEASDREGAINRACDIVKKLQGYADACRTPWSNEKLLERLLINKPTASTRKERARRAIERATGGSLVRQNHDTYVTITGKVVHIRSNKAYPRPGGEYSYWFGLQEKKWIDGEFFVLVCGEDATLVFPVTELKKYKSLMAPAKAGERLEWQPVIYKRTDGRFELRGKGERIDFTEWVDRFDLLL